MPEDTMWKDELAIQKEIRLNEELKSPIRRHLDTLMTWQVEDQQTADYAALRQAKREQLLNQQKEDYEAIFHTAWKDLSETKAKTTTLGEPVQQQAPKKMSFKEKQ